MDFKSNIEFFLGPNSEFSYQILDFNFAIYALFKTFQNEIFQIHNKSLCFLAIDLNNGCKPIAKTEFFLSEDHNLTLYEDSYLCMLIDHISFFKKSNLIYFSCNYNDDSSISVFISCDPYYSPNMVGHILDYGDFNRKILFSNTIFSKLHLITGQSVDEDFTWSYINEAKHYPQINETMKSLSNLKLK